MLASMIASAPALETKVAFLRNLCGHGDEAIETHFAWLFLVGEHAWKLRKPLARDTMDYRTLEARRRGTCDEIRLNRRLAPTVYLDAVALTVDDTGRLAIGGRGEVVDWLVCMRRLDRTLLLDAQLQRTECDDALLAPVARLLADFYRAARAEIVDGPAYVDRLQRQVAANHAALAAAARPQAGRLHDAQQRFLDRHADVLSQRSASGCVAEAHGDLRPEHVFLGTPAAIIDCLEFDRELRILDRAEELSFLELECARSGDRRAGPSLRRQTLAQLDDAPPARLLAFYRSHRGATRAKLHAWRAAEADAGSPVAWLERADDYVNGALADAASALA